jgi:hypothetical protein
MNTPLIKQFLSIVLLSSIAITSASECTLQSDCNITKAKIRSAQDEEAAIITAQDNGKFEVEAGNFVIGKPTITDPLFTGIPRDQTSFAISIPILYVGKLPEAPTLQGTYQTATSTTLLGQMFKSGSASAQIEACEISFSAVTNLGFIMRIGFFVQGPGFITIDVDSIIEQLADLGFAVHFGWQATPAHKTNLKQHRAKKIEKGGILTALNNGTLGVVAGDFTLGQPSVVDPLVVGLPNNQSGFGLRIPITFNKAVHPMPIIVATYRTTLVPRLVSKTLTGTASAFVENVEVSISDVTSQGFTLNVGFFTFFDPGFTNATLGSLLTQLAEFGFGVNFIWRT